MEEGKMLFRVIDHICVLKLTGSIVYTMSSSFDWFLKKIIKDKSVTSFIVDLTSTTYIDSTNLGLLARLYEFRLTKRVNNVTMVSCNRTVNEILRSVGFFKIFTIVESMENFDIDLQEMAQDTSSRNNLKETMLSAHRSLGKLNMGNKEQFKDVIKFLEKESER